MQSLMRVLAIILLLFPSASFANYTELYPVLTKTVSGDLSFVIYCDDYLVIDKIYQRYGSQTSGTVIDLVLPNETVRATTTSTAGILEYSLSHTDCSPNNSISATLDFISGDSAWNWYRLPYTPYGGTMPYNEMVIYADASEASYWFPQGYNFHYKDIEVISSGGGSGDMATTTVITENDQIFNFFLLYVICAITLFGVIYLLKPFYVRK